MFRAALFGLVLGSCPAVALARPSHAPALAAGEALATRRADLPLHDWPEPAPPEALPDGGAVQLRVGERWLRVAPRLVIDVGRARDALLRPRAVGVDSWRTEERTGGWSLVAHLEDPGGDVRATLRLARAGGDAAAALSVEVVPLRDGWVREIALELPVEGAAPRVRDRGLASRPLATVAYLDRFAAKEVRAGGAAWIVDDGVDGVTLQRTASGAVLRAELFSTAARPFQHDARCNVSWRAPNRKVPLPSRLRLTGERLAARVTIAADGPTLAKARWPDGRRAALVFTDHADQSSPETLAALARGRSDARSPVGGLLGHRLAITKSLFFWGADRPQLDDPDAFSVAADLARHGTEIILHSATPHPDRREATRAALDFVDRFVARSWIDHQPQTNCEAFTNQGWRREGPFAIADLLDAHRYRYVWAAEDAHATDLDLLGGGLERRAPTLWPIGRLAPGDRAGDERWLFRSVWMFLDRPQLQEALGAARLDDLEGGRGLAILHTYLETLHPKGTPFGKKNLLVRLPGGVLATHPVFEQLLGRLRARVDRGTLWVPTLRELGDHLRAVEQVAVRYRADGGAAIEAPLDVWGASFFVPGAVEVLVDGEAPDGVRTDGEGTTFWIDLAAGRPARVTLRDPTGRALPFLR